MFAPTCITVCACLLVVNTLIDVLLKYSSIAGVTFWNTTSVFTLHVVIIGMSFLEGKGWTQSKRELQAKFLPSYKVRIC